MAAAGASSVSWQKARIDGRNYVERVTDKATVPETRSDAPVPPAASRGRPTQNARQRPAVTGGTH
jgi:hypothetical protein